MKRVIIVHRWGATPNSDWYSWLKEKLEKRGYKVLIPQMPGTNYPKIENWLPKLTEVAGEVNENTYLVGHSMGSQTILRFLETLPEGKKVGKVIFAAGFVTLMGLTKEEEVVAEPWLKTPIDFEKIKNKTREFVAIFSDNDPFVPLEENRKVLEEKLGAKVIIEHNKGHFTEDNGVVSSPVLLKYL